MTRPVLFPAGGLALALMVGSTAAVAQGVTAFGGDNPIEIEADQGIEWRRDENVYIARGDVRAISGTVQVFADEMSAFYRESAADQTEVYLIEVTGDVRIQSPSGTVFGQRGRYIIGESRFELTGHDLKLVSAGSADTVTARDSLEYWEAKQIAVARGEATATHRDQQLRADTLTAYFAPGSGGNLQVERIVAKGNVEIQTPNEFAVGDEGVYYVDKEFATLAGDVKITRGDNQLNGGYAEVDLASGVSKLLANPPGASKPSRVQGLIVPKSKPDS